MRDKELRRIYGYNPANKTYHIHIDLDNYRDVYSEWDFSPLINRDLDEDLIEYILGCSREIGLKRRMSLVFHMPLSLKDIMKEKRSIEGYQHYFEYQIRLLRTAKWDKRFEGLRTFVLGIVLIILANLSHLIPLPELGSNILSEGLIIGAWVAMWETFSLVLFGSRDQKAKLKQYKRLKDVPILYEYTRD